MVSNTRLASLIALFWYSVAEQTLITTLLLEIPPRSNTQFRAAENGRLLGWGACLELEHGTFRFVDQHINHWAIESLSHNDQNLKYHYQIQFLSHYVHLLHYSAIYANLFRSVSYYFEHWETVVFERRVKRDCLQL